MLPSERYDRFVDRSGGPDVCWPWTGRKAGGYGRFRLSRVKSVQATRYGYERVNGPIPEGLELDHLCRTPVCVNPSHLEPVTHRENVLRGEGLGARYARRTVCAEGHPLSGPNLQMDAGARRCRTCRRAYANALKRRRKP